MSSPITLAIDDLTRMTRTCFERAGVQSEFAATIAEVLVDADMRGVPSHGTTRVDSYLQRMHNGFIDPLGRPKIEVEQGGMMLLDGQNGFGAVAATDAAKLAIEKVKTAGVVWMTVRGTNHIGPLGYYTHWLAEHGVTSILFCNAAPTVAGWGGTRPVYGTNPFSAGVPGGERQVCLDMATTQVAKGKIRRAAAEDRPIPEGLAFDQQGQPTTNAHEALVGTLAPMGGYKGYGLAMIVDLLTGVLANGSSGPDVLSAGDPNGLSGSSFTLIAADAAHFGSVDALRSRVDTHADFIRGSGDPEQDVMMPGEPESRRRETARANGVSIARDVYDNLIRLSGESNSGGSRA